MLQICISTRASGSCIAWWINLPSYSLNLPTSWTNDMFSRKWIAFWPAFLQSPPRNASGELRAAWTERAFAPKVIRWAQKQGRDITALTSVRPWQQFAISQGCQGIGCCCNFPKIVAHRGRAHPLKEGRKEGRTYLVRWFQLGRTVLHGKDGDLKRGIDRNLGDHDIGCHCQPSSANNVQSSSMICSSRWKGDAQIRYVPIQSPKQQLAIWQAYNKWKTRVANLAGLTLYSCVCVLLDLQHIKAAGCIVSGQHSPFNCHGGIQ